MQLCRHAQPAGDVCCWARAQLAAGGGPACRAQFYAAWAQSRPLCLQAQGPPQPLLSVHALALLASCAQGRGPRLQHDLPQASWQRHEEGLGQSQHKSSQLHAGAGTQATCHDTLPGDKRAAHAPARTGDARPAIVVLPRWPGHPVGAPCFARRILWQPRPARLRPSAPAPPSDAVPECSMSAGLATLCFHGPVLFTSCLRCVCCSAGPGRCRSSFHHIQQVVTDVLATLQRLGPDQGKVLGQCGPSPAPSLGLLCRCLAPRPCPIASPPLPPSSPPTHPSTHHTDTKTHTHTHTHNLSLSPTSTEPSSPTTQTNVSALFFWSMFVQHLTSTTC